MNLLVLPKDMQSTVTQPKEEEKNIQGKTREGQDGGFLPVSRTERILVGRSQF